MSKSDLHQADRSTLRVSAVRFKPCRYTMFCRTWCQKWDLLFVHEICTMLIDLHGVRSEIQTMLLYNIMFCRTWCQKWDLLHAATDSPFVHGVRGGIQNHADILVVWYQTCNSKSCGWKNIMVTKVGSFEPCR